MFPQTVFAVAGGEVVTAEGHQLPIGCGDVDATGTQSFQVDGIRIHEAGDGYREHTGGKTLQASGDRDAATSSSIHGSFHAFALSSQEVHEATFLESGYNITVGIFRDKSGKGGCLRVAATVVARGQEHGGTGAVGTTAWYLQKIAGCEEGGLFCKEGGYGGQAEVAGVLGMASKVAYGLEVDAAYGVEVFKRKPHNVSELVVVDIADDGGYKNDGESGTATRGDGLLLGFGKARSFADGVVDAATKAVELQVDGGGSSITQGFGVSVF